MELALRTEVQKGVLAMVVACLVWGLSPLYYKMLVSVPPIELLSHRTLWSMVLFALILFMQGRLRGALGVLGNKNIMATLFIAALMIAFNWFIFIYSIQINRATETSLGYFIFPLVSVIFGVVLFREKLSRAQISAVLLAAFSVLILTYGLGQVPWIALSVSISFGIYGVIKKSLSIPAIVTVTLEVLLLSPIALMILYFYHASGSGGQFGQSASISLLLILSGPMTATPLILFSYATRRVALATVGILQYINPSLQFLCATVLFLEPLSIWHAVAFPLIWFALALYTWASFQTARRSI
ncbi:MAG: EamA family transporter RarD [Marinovum sp.]|nr:EamA family transporter RarD [Marinovum sp.]MBT6534223.1 EamA family transporter RarD [Marinovum sp.]